MFDEPSAVRKADGFAQQIRVPAQSLSGSPHPTLPITSRLSTRNQHPIAANQHAMHNQLAPLFTHAQAISTYSISTYVAAIDTLSTLPGAFRDRLNGK